MKKIKVAYIGGGSKNWGHNYFSDFLLQDKFGGELRLYDIDAEASEINKKYFDNLVRDNQDKIKSEWSCRVINDIDEALNGVDVVLISILPYSLFNMYHDVHYPEKYGIFQSVGDTVGPGGYSRALRTIPTFKFFGEKIRDNCPDAWVINYTNPMTLCINTLYKAFPKIKAFGCCHEVFGTQWLLAAIVSLYNSLSDEGQKAFMEGNLPLVKAECRKNKKNFREIYTFNEKGINKREGTILDKRTNVEPIIDRSEIKVNVQGINHFTFINKAEYNGTDIIPIYRAFIRMFRLNNKAIIDSPIVPDKFKLSINKESVKYELFEKYGVIAAAGDRHLAEFVPYKYLKNRHVLSNGFKLTTVRSRILSDLRLKIITKKLANGTSKVVIKGSGEEGVKQITALLGLGDLITNVNLLNNGQIGNLPLGTAVETNAAFTENSIKPVDAGNLDKEVLPLVQIHAENQKAFVEAYFAHDRNGLINVFLRDPSVTRLTEKNGRKLFEELVALNQECLEDWVKNN